MAEAHHTTYPCNAQPASPSPSANMNHPDQHTEEFLTVREAAMRLGVPERFIYRMAANREITHYRIGIGRGTIRIVAADLEEYIQEHGT